MKKDKKIPKEKRYSLGHTDYMAKKIYEQLLSVDMSEVYRNPEELNYWQKG